MDFQYNFTVTGILVMPNFITTVLYTSVAVRSISGHKAAICSLDFHRYGDILASGSMDTNLKVKDP